MYDIEGSLDRQILQISKNRPTIVFVEPKDPRIIEAACSLTRFIRPVLLATEAEIREVVARELAGVDSNRIDYGLSECVFVDIPSRPDLVGEFAKGYVDFQAGAGEAVSLEEAARLVSDPVLFGICAVKFGHADTVVGGAVHSDRNYSRPMMRMLARREFLCEAGVFVLPDEHTEGIFPHNIVVFGDIGVNANVTPEILAQTAVGTCAIARDIFPEDVLPEIRGAIISYSDWGSDDGPSPALVRAATELVPKYLEERIKKGERYKSIKIQGEVKINAALSQRSAMYYRSRLENWPGPPNVVICPNLDMGNLLYHLYAVRFPAAKKFPVFFALHFGGVDLAMDCGPEDIRLAVKACALRMHKYGEWTRTPKDTFFRRYRVLALNPGSTSTKLSIFEGDLEIIARELQHSAEELKPFEGRPITEQFQFRKDAIEKFLIENGFTMGDIDAVSGRGGVLWPISHGTYTVNEAMAEDLRAGVQGDHASNLGGLIARELVAGSGKPAFIVDPVVVDETPERVKITGVKAIRRKIISHALNQIATARRYAEENETFYEKLNVIVAHLGGGISIGAHKQGHYLDVNNALDGEGPFTPQRSGSLPVGQLIELCFSGQYTKAELKQLNKGRGGLIDLLGTADLRDLERRYKEGEQAVVDTLDAMAYQISKWITSMIPAFDGEPIDQILLTGGAARCKVVVDYIKTHVGAVGCGVTVYPGENEMAALVKGALRVLSGKEKAKDYRPR
ncbi:MAG TPA: butyrate kinase [Holophaga sp.]|nr:butyrate kinase [Holophaga sp.]HPS66666.1 butyrate kinase [Holophaga sp.]